MPIVIFLLFVIVGVALYYRGKLVGYEAGKADGIVEADAKYVDKVEVETKEVVV